MHRWLVKTGRRQQGEKVQRMRSVPHEPYMYPRPCFETVETYTLLR